MNQTIPKQNNDTSVIEIVELDPSEMQLIRNLRTKFRFGEVTIVMKDGLPFRLRRIMEFAELGEQKG